MAAIAMALRRARRGVLFPNMWRTPRLTGTSTVGYVGRRRPTSGGVSLPDEVAQNLRLLWVVGDAEVGAAHHRPGPDPALVEPGGDERRDPPLGALGGHLGVERIPQEARHVELGLAQHGLG